MKHGAIISDLHCGHKFGLCPPEFQVAESDDYKQEKIRTWQTKTYEWYATEAHGLGKLDRLIVNGDAIDGDGAKSGGTELWSTDRLLQVEAAIKCINQFDFANITVVSGTAYHAGQEEPFESLIADEYGVRLQDHAWLEESGCVMDIKHHIGSTSVPGAIPVSLPREEVWNSLWAEHQMQPRSNVFIRSHLHHHYFCGDNDFTAIVTPALQGWTKYGAQRKSNTVDYGFIEFWISDKGVFTWTTHALIPMFSATKAEPV